MPDTFLNRAGTFGDLMTLDGNPIRDSHFSHAEVAGMVRMLTRDQIDHEAVCTIGRDRILWLASRVGELEALTQRRCVRFYCVADVLAVMGDDRPSAEILTARGLDIPWTKRLCERTGCTFREGRHAHDLLAHQHELTALRATHSRRVTELLHANNGEVERRRAAERRAQDLERRLAKEERDHLRTIDDREEAEAALGTAFYMVTGRHPEWSSAFDYADALEELQEHVAYLLAAEEDAQEAIDPREREGNHAEWAVFGIFGLTFLALRGDMLATGIMLAFVLWHLIKAAVWSERAGAVEVRHG